MTSALPDYDDLPTRAGLRAAWGVWGEGDDVFGCLNLLTPERVAAATGLVRRGAVFALNWSMALPDPPLFGRGKFEHEVTGTGTGHDDVLHGWNTQSSSQWDGFRHIRNHAAQRVRARHRPLRWCARRGARDPSLGATWHRRSGRARRHRPLAGGERAAAAIRRVRRHRSGRDRRVSRGPGQRRWRRATSCSCGPDGSSGTSASRATSATRLGDVGELKAPGFASGEELARTLWNLHIAAIGCDNPGVEVWPPSRLTRAEYEAAREEQMHLHEVFTHCVLLPLLGLPLGEMWDLEALAADCAADGRYECFFTSAPLNLPAGVASPPNALAIK